METESLTYLFPRAKSWSRRHTRCFVWWWTFNHVQLCWLFCSQQVQPISKWTFDYFVL